MDRNVFEAAWTTLSFGCQSNNIKFKTALRKDFVKRCSELYNSVAENYMTSEPMSKLDRHKLASIIAIIGSDEKYYVDYITLKDDKINPTRFHIAIEVALCLIQEEINKDLKQSECFEGEGKVDLYIPKAAICTTNYISSIGRIMYFEEEGKIPSILRVLELANTLFLIEECTLIKQGIAMEQWINFKRNQYKNNS